MKIEDSYNNKGFFINTEPSKAVTIVLNVIGISFAIGFFITAGVLSMLKIMGII